MNLSFTDSHVHFWDLANQRMRYEWLLTQTPDPILGNISAIASQRYSADDLIAETRFHNVGKVVHVEMANGGQDPIAETRWLQALADRLGLPNGIIAYVDLGDPRAAEIIRGHMTYANFRGVRNLRHGRYLDAEYWRRGFSLLRENELVYCDSPPIELMSGVADLVSRFANCTYCVDHAGFPKRRDAKYFQAWRSGMRKLAEAENTVVKISGLGMADHLWTRDSISPWILECIDAWGVDRAFFGTNWPIDRLYSSYGDVVEAYRDLLSDLSVVDQEKLLSRNADRVFRL